ncbi:FAD-dependent monooxygenase [Paenibacillus nasutitermitis]|uniref:Monooxygenase n=1 Tax=Paenibacillus nasutitermitis TaxID=1652958 RepID=A0A916YYV6_9BACL|nr:FAD-dependent monooxygenase [Paenibacillus nasutitermitis]GGD67156.1 monooxygenase [Paenibacillus nasutitermitis]
MEIASQMPTNKEALIIGAGIGGLCAAIALRQQGWTVKIFDKSTAQAGLGAGIVLAANAMKALDLLGVGAEIRDKGAAVGKAEIRLPDGRLVTALPADEQASRYGTHSYLIHRAVLQHILRNHLASMSPEAVIYWGMKLTGIHNRSDSVTASFENGEEQEADVLIGCDGIHSVVRQHVASVDDNPLRYGGFTALRGITTFKDSRYPAGVGGGFEAWGRGLRFGFSQLGEGRVFWFGAINAPKGMLAPAGRRKEAALRYFRGWCDPIEAVIAATDEEAILSHDLFDREPLQSWSSGRVTLLGDAAHPMLPNLGQGGGQAIEDAVMLGYQLGQVARSGEGIPAALQAYEGSRIPRTSRIVRQSRRMARLVQLENPIARGLRNRLLRSIPASFQASRLDWLVGYNISRQLDNGGLNGKMRDF